MKNQDLIRHTLGKAIHKGEYHRDGLYYEATFRSPRGMAYHPHTNQLLIADMQNHRIRQMSLETYVVTTLAGTSSQVDRFDYPVGGHVDGPAAALPAIRMMRPWKLIVGALPILSLKNTEAHFK